MAWFVREEYRNSDKGTYWSPDIAPIESEHERLNQAGLALRQSIKEQWQANGRALRSPFRPDYGASKIPPLLQGWKYPPFDPPLKDQLKKPEGELVDIISSSFGTYAISQKVIDIIERIEPGVHSYVAYEMVQPDGTLHPGRRWLLNICTRLELIDVGQSNVVELSSGKFADITAGGRKPHIVVKADECSERAIWFEWRYNRDAFLVSDCFWDALQAQGIKGWSPNFGSYPDHIEEV